MKITFPKTKRIINGSGDSVLYIVVSQHKDGTWGFADFWGLPYSSGNYLDAKKLQKSIVEKAIKYNGTIWSKGHFTLAKIVF